MSMLAGGEISPATASEWAKYYDGRFNSTNLQKTNFVDFDFKTVFGILDLLERSQSGWDPDRGGFRIYFGAYPDTYSNVGLRNHINTMLVGTYDHTDVEKYYNLGHLCPPNCYGSGTSTIDYTRSPILR